MHPPVLLVLDEGLQVNSLQLPEISLE